jgi:fermentation-respiration switch protein FrsA (DUF1100 family)
MMRTIATIAAIGGAAYLLFAALVYVMQERMLFLPGVPGRALEVTPLELGLDYEDVNFDTDDGVALHGWYVSTPAPRGTVLFFHGNAGNVSHRLDSIAIFHALGLDVFIIDYRGYGRSQGRASESGTYRDAEAAWRYLTAERRIDPARIVIFGRSLGGAVAARLASTVEPAAVIIESSFTSAADVASRLYPFLPVRFLLRLEYPVADDLERSSSPVLVVHSRGDEIIPFGMGRALYEAAPQPKAFLELAGDHNTAFLIDRDRYLRGLRTFLDVHLGIDPQQVEEWRASRRLSGQPVNGG